MTDAEWALVMRTAEREYYVNKRGMCKTINLETGKEVVNDGLLVRDRNMERLYLNQ